MMNESTNFNSLDQLAHEFAERLRRGERPTVEEYAEQHPHLAAEIRDFFPTLMLMEAQLTPASSPSSPRTDTSWPRDLPSQLGDYRILRELGRGGMGVVYEAIQETLGRHVALKVLPPRHMSQAIDVERFRREARAAAQLHHTNIVPVFDVGEADGVHFYAMQFIDGQPLNRLLDGTQRRPEHHSQFALGVAHWQAAQQAEIADLAHRADQSAGSAPDTEPGGIQINDTPVHASAAGQSANDLVAPERGYCRSGTSPEFRRVTGISVFWRKPLPASTSTILNGSRRQHYLHVARIGKQVAEALAYAHGQGVLHRDIKPANLLLDSAGVVWIADFGLARVEGLDELTSPGDVVGTLRYLPPERFEGHSDERGDVYGVGITLYELLTSRPAFTASSRATLIDNILHTSPLSPRRIDPHIPRDLQTIVLKAMAADPSQRYARAEALAADLNRFIEDRPILARRLSPWGHTWRWCRRNKALASMISLAAALLVAVAVVSLVSSFKLRGQLKETIAAQREVQEQLFDSLMSQAHEKWNSDGPGQRFETLKVLREATRIARELELAPASFDSIRNETIAALCLPDVEITRKLKAWLPGTTTVDFDPRFERYARGDVDGNVTIHRVSDNAILHHLPSPRPDMQVENDFGILFSPNGQYLQQVSFNIVGGGGCLRLWDLSGSEPKITFEVGGVCGGNCAFRSDSQQIVVVTTDLAPSGPVEATAGAWVHVYETATGRECVAALRGEEFSWVAFHPLVSRLAVSDASAVRIVDLDTGAESGRWERSNTNCMAWSPDGRQLAAASASDRLIQRWDAERKQSLPPLSGHSGRVNGIAFDHQSNLIVSSDRPSNILRLWDPPSGRLLLNAPGGSLPNKRFTEDNQLFSGTLGAAPELRLLKVARGRELQRFALEAQIVRGMPTAVLHADCRTLAVTSRDGTVLLDVQRGEQLAVIPG
jgi:serine/threonine protein kinase